MGNKLFVKAIREDGNVDLLIYGRHTDIDTLVLMEVEGRIKNSNKPYLVVDSVNIIDRFEQIRESFSKLSVAMLLLEISYRANCCFGLLIECLNRLKEWDGLFSLICFLYLFLKENGILKQDIFTPYQIEILQEIIEKKPKLPKSTDRKALIALKNILIKETQEYLGRQLNSLKLLKI